ARLADAQLEVARQHGFSSWRALKAHIDSLTVDGQLFDAAKSGDVGTLAALLDKHPEKLYARAKPYEWSLLHTAAWNGHLAAVDLLLKRGLPVNVREKGDDTYAMHWAAAQGHLEIVRRLADAGGDVIGRGDDHELEIIGWATCWDHPHEDVAEFLVRRGARHHIFSAIAMSLADEVRRIVAVDPAALHQPMSHNEDYRRPLHFAVQKNRPEMVALLLELGADPLAPDGSGYPATAYATAPGIDRRVLEAIVARGGSPDLFTALALGDEAAAARLLSANRGDDGVLHRMAKRGDAQAVKWLLDQGADPNARWDHWDASVTPLHLAAAQGHSEVVRLLLEAGADPRLRDSKHDGDAFGWAFHHGRQHVLQILEASRKIE
ncbi:MAG TPA: ankyrin repeat domain-containing protein, partial [Thermoanaerobaculia bacterium]|nr:ankyrin repeat domain-containing protein [Thermoanaerobaculia bacterium]